MSDLRLQVGADFALMAAALYFLGGLGALCAVMAASAVHELGHLLALELVGARPMRLRLGAGGAVLDYALEPTPGREALVLALGPAAGLLFGLLCLSLGNGAFFRCTGFAALLSTAFNLLPALPLDGGRLAELALGRFLPGQRVRRWMLLLGNLAALLLLALGLRLKLIVLAAVGIWLGLLVNFPGLR